jgi:hypothetical protein
VSPTSPGAVVVVVVVVEVAVVRTSDLGPRTSNLEPFTVQRASV